VPKPETAGREIIFEIHTRNMNLAADVDFVELAETTPDASGADIKAICTEAGMFAIRDDRTEVTSEDFVAAHEKLRQDEDAGVDDSLAFA